MTAIALKTYSQGAQILVAAADADLLGQTFAEGKLKLDLTTGFYDDLRTDEEGLRRHLAVASIANLVGPATVATAVELGLIEADAVGTVEGVPHAQLMVLA